MSNQTARLVRESFGKPVRIEVTTDRDPRTFSAVTIDGTRILFTMATARPLAKELSLGSSRSLVGVYRGAELMATYENGREI